MCTPYGRNSYVLQLLDAEIMSPIPPHGSCLQHVAGGDSGAFHSSQPVQDEHIYAQGFSTDARQTSPLQNGSWNSTCSSEIHSNMSLSENGFDAGFPALDGDVNSFLNFSGRPNFALPTKNHPMVSQDPFNDWDGNLITRQQLPNLNTHVTPNQALAIQSAGSDNWGDNNAWDGGLVMPSHGSFLMEQTGYDFLSLAVQ